MRVTETHQKILDSIERDDYLSSCKLLQITNNSIFKNLNLIFSNFPKIDSECKDYAGYNFSISNKDFKFRVAKKTPTKLGHFVTLWKRSIQGSITPFDVEDLFDFYIICIEEGQFKGQFVFPKDLLAKQGILSKNSKGGKRAIRVYSPWVETVSSQAEKTKKWQIEYFLDLSDTNNINLNLAKELYSLE